LTDASAFPPTFEESLPKNLPSVESLMISDTRRSWLANAAFLVAILFISCTGPELIAQQLDTPTLDSFTAGLQADWPQAPEVCTYQCPEGNPPTWRSFTSTLVLANGCKVGVMVYYRIDCNGNHEFTFVDWQVAATSACYSMNPWDLRREVEHAILKQNRMGWDPKKEGDPCVYAIKAHRVECYDKVWRATNPLIDAEPGWLWFPCPSSIHACCEYLWEVCWEGGENGERNPVPIGIAIPRDPACQDATMPWETYTGCFNMCNPS
jgi:hypothetical protein